MRRRTLLRAGLLYGGSACLGDLSAVVDRLVQGCADAAPAGELVGLVPLHGDRARSTPFGQMLGGPGLDARLFTDLSTLQPNQLVTPTERVFVRTQAPPAMQATPTRWAIALRRDATSTPLTISTESLQRDAQPMGQHLIECAGNADPDNFGLMSVADWHGVPLTRILAAVPRGESTGVLVSGVDHSESRAQTSSPGASWILPLDALERLGAFLAVRMNDAPLTPDHGAPVRLVVPGWYGCSWIKWVDQLRLVGATEPSTLQMQEFSRRTHQDGVPRLAHEYQPPAIDLAAAPVRVEQRRVAARLEYRVVGIVWGGERPVDRLTIRFRAGDNPQPFSICPVPRTHRTWSLWEYRWRPTTPGVYDIALKPADPSIRARRLDLSYYVRRIVIDEI